MNIYEHIHKAQFANEYNKKEILKTTERNLIITKGENKIELTWNELIKIMEIMINEETGTRKEI